MKTQVAIIIPNWNGKDIVGHTIQSLLHQSVRPHIIVVDNGSVDGSTEYISKKFPYVELLKNKTNLGFAGGVNVGIRKALKDDYSYIGLLNNDAVVDKKWVENLLKTLLENKQTGAATGLIAGEDGKHIDNTGDGYSTWGLTISLNRDKTIQNAPNGSDYVFGACAGSCLYRAEVFKSIGLFDERFFAYYEDTDFNFRMQLGGWRVLYVPSAITKHATGTTSSKIKGFTTYHTMKNLPMLFWKNVPLRYVPHIFPRLFLAYWTIMLKSIFTGKAWHAIKGHSVWLKNIPHTFKQRARIQKNKKVTNEYIWSILTHDLPPNARALRKLRYYISLGRIKP